MPASPEDAKNLFQRACQRDEPLGHADHHDKFKSGIGKRQTVDVAHSREHPRLQAGLPCFGSRSVDHLRNAIDGRDAEAFLRHRGGDDTRAASDLQNRRTGR